jgi:hypothetical protein
MRVSGVLAVLSCLLPGMAQAQAPGTPAHPGLATESVTVTGSDKALHDFIKSYTASSQPSGKIARWRIGACPITAGLPPAANKLVNDRVRQVAALAGAPVGDVHCKPNILLGYHTASQEDAAAMTHPVQAWYTTQTVDLNGSAYLDRAQTNTPGYIVDTPFGPVYLQDAPAVHVTGNHLDDGLSSELFHVIVVIDLAKVKGFTLGALSDYAAMLSLSRTQSFEACQPVASITNVLAGSCAQEWKTSEISSSDLGYLRGLYRINPRNSFQRQKDEIAYAMKKGAGER